jgi:hypothetical protein
MITVKVDSKQIQKLAEIGFPNAVDSAVKYTADDVHGNIGREAPVDEGRLSGSYRLKKLGWAKYGISSNTKYRWWVHEGTGIFGPHKKPIVPVRASVLRFEINGKVIFAKSVKGQKPNRFIDRSIDKTRQRVQEFVNRAIREVKI